MGSLADLYATVRPDLSKLAPELRAGLRPIGKMAGEVLGDAVGKGAGGRFGSNFQGSIKKAMGRGFVAIGVAAGAALGGALTKGFGRLSAIENAEAKLTGLGHSAKTVEKIMGSALASVKGTAFGLDAAATVAAAAVAAGIKPGQKLQHTLKLVADAATIGGTSLADMGGIFNQVAASNKIQGDTINQLNDRGIPILKLLADVTGKSQGEVSKLASKGKIDFATFQKAMEKGLGGAALKSGGTASGAFKNMGAAFSRVGAALLKGVFPQIGGGFGTITKFLDAITPAAERFGKAFGTVLKSLGQAAKVFFDALRGKSEINEFNGALKVINNAGVILGDWLRVAWRAAKVFFDALRGKSELNEFSGGLKVINNIGVLLIPTLIQIGKFLGDVFHGRWAAAGAQLQEWGGKVVDWIQNTAAPWIWEKLQILGVQLGAWIKPRIPIVIEKLKEWGGKLADWIQNTAAPWVWAKLQALGAKLEAWIRPRIPGMIAKLQEFGAKIGNWIINKGLPMLGGWLGKMGAKLQAWIIPRIPGMIANLVKFGIAINNWIVTKGIPMLIKGALKMAGEFIKGFYNEAKRQDLPGKVKALITDMWNKAKAKLADVVAGMKAKGRDIINGLLGGMKAPFEALKTWVGGIATWIKAHKGPLSLDSTLLAPAGKALMGGLLHGLKVGFGPVGDFVYGVSGSVKSIISKIGSSIASVFSGGVPGVSGSGASGIRALARALHTSLNHHIDPQGGNAYDIFGSGALNSKIAEALRRNHAKLGLRYVISQMRIASARSGWNWRGYHPITNQGDYRHTGHVHVSYARGTLNAAPGIARLAEKGSELVVGSQLRNMGGGGQRVFNHRETQALLGGGGGRPITILIDLGDGLRQRVEGMLDEHDEFQASVRRTR